MKITFIFSCSGMFRHVPECSGMFHVPGFIDALICVWFWNSYLFTESRKVCGKVLDRTRNFELRYSGARPLRDLKTIKAFWISRWVLRFFQFKVWNSCDASASLRKLELALHDFGVFEVCLLVLCHSLPKQRCNSWNAAESRRCR